MNALKAAAKDTLPIGIGYLPLSIAFGMMLVQIGIHWSIAPLFSALIFSGTLQYVAIPMLAASAPLVDFFITALIVNSRLIFYGLGYPIHKLSRKRTSCLAIFTLTDEMYSLMTSEKAKDYCEHKTLWAHMISYAYWIIGSLVGALLATRLPSMKGLEFSLTALIIVLCMEQGYSKKRSFPFILGVSSSVVALTLWPDQFLFLALILSMAGLSLSYWNKKKSALEATPS